MIFYISKLQNAEVAHKYLEHLAKNYSDLTAEEIQNYILKTIADSTINKTPQPAILSSKELPEVESVHVEMACNYLDSVVLAFQDEETIKEVEIGALGEQFMGFPKGTLFLKRYTNISECYWFFSCIRAVNGQVIRSVHPNEELEKKLLSLPSIKVINYSKPDSLPNIVEPTDILTSFALIIIKSVVGVAVNKLGGLALDYIERKLGIAPVDANEKSYHQLVNLIKIEFRQKLVNDMRKYLSSAVTAMEEYNNGLRTETTLRTAYDNISELRSYFIETEIGEDTTIIRGTALVLQLMVIQEMAIFYGGKKRYTHYLSMVENAPDYAKALRKMRTANYGYRLSFINGVNYEDVFLGNLWRVWWDDTGIPYGQSKKADSWKRWDVFEEFKINRNNHYTNIANSLNSSFKTTDGIIETLETLGKGIISGSQLSVANMQQIWMTLHGMLFQYVEDKWKPIFIDLTTSGRKKNIWLSTVSVGVDGTVMVLFKDIYEIEEKPQSLCTLINGKWEIIDNDCISIGVGDANNVWKVNHKKEVFQRNINTNTWDKVQGQLEQIAVGADGAVCGLNSKGKPMRYNKGNNSWEDLGQEFTHISVGNAEIIWALNKDGAVYQYSEKDKKWIHKTNRKIANVSVGVENIPWFEDEFGNLFRRSNWEYIPTETPVKDVGVYNSSTVYCLAEGGTITQYVNGKFEKVEGPPNCKFKSLSVGNSDICGIQDHEKNIPWIRRNGKWESAGDEAISLSIGDTVWGLFWAGGWVRYWEYAWQSLPGNPQLRQISVESAKAVWALTSIPGIPHTLVNMKKFTPVGSKKFQYIAVGNATHVCGIDENSAIHKYLPEGSLWQYLESGCTKISMGTGGELYGINSTGHLLKYHPEGSFDLPIKSPFAVLDL